MVVGLCFIVLSLLLLPSLLPGSLSLSLSCRRSLPPTCTQATMSEGEARIRFSIGTEQSGKADGVFSNPRGLAFDHHRRHLFVVDCNNYRVQVFSSIEDDACGGEFLSAFSSFAGSPRVRRFAFDNDALLSPWGIAIDHDHDRLVLADSGNHRVQLWSLSEQSFLSSVGQRGTHLELRNPLGVAIDKHHDRIVITDTYNHRLVFLSSLDLSFLFEIGKHGSQPGEFFVPTGVAIDHDRHRIIVCDSFNHRVQVLSSIDGSFLFEFGSPCGSQPGQLKLPRGVCIANQGRIIVADTGNRRLQAFTHEGHHISSFECGSLGEPIEVAFDEHRGLIAFSARHQVHVIGANQWLADTFTWLPFRYRDAPSWMKQAVSTMTMIRSLVDESVLSMIPNELLFEILSFL